VITSVKDIIYSFEAFLEDIRNDMHIINT